VTAALAALRTVALEDAELLALLGGPGDPRWYEGEAPVEQREPCIVAQVVSITPRQAQRGLSPVRRADVQLDAWADGDDGATVAETLGDAVLRACIERGHGRRIGDVWLRATQVVRPATCNKTRLEELGAPAWRYQVELRVTYVPLRGGA
jgi:hypothetical protein